MKKGTKLIALVIALVVAVAACGGQSAEEALLEQILESGDNGITDLDIDTDNGGFNISVEGEDGQDINITSQDDDGSFNMTIEGEDGETFTFGGGEVPDGMQTPIPDGGSVTGSYTSDSDRSVSLEYDRSMFDELVAVYDAAFGGDDVSRSESSYTTDDGTVRNVGWYNNDTGANVSVSDCYSISTGELSSVCLTIYEYDS